MENQIKLNVTVVSNKGLLQSDNGENFFLNGRFRHDFESENIQVSIQNVVEQYHTLAICEGMDKGRGDSKAFISMIRELKRFYDQIKANPKSIDSIQNDLAGRIREISNLIHSVSVGTEEFSYAKLAFCGMVISRGNAFVANMGGSKAYLSRSGNVKQITADRKKADRLVKLGIISTEQAEVLSKDYINPTDEEQSEVHFYPLNDIMEGDVFLFCSEVLANSIDEEIIQEILSVKGDAEYLANTLLKEARKSIDGESISVLVVKIEKSLENEVAKPIMSKKAPEINAESFVESSYDEEGRSPAKTILLAVLTSIILIGLFTAGYLFLTRDRNKTETSKPVTTEASVQPTVSEAAYNENVPVTATNNVQPSKPTDSFNKDAGKYKVKAGDSLAKISKMFYGDTGKVKYIMDANNIKDANRITVGQVLIIPKIGDIKPKLPPATAAP